MGNFNLGQVLETRNVYDSCRENRYFDIFVRCSLQRYCNGDWGDLCEEDIESNNYAVRNGERILAAYIFDTNDVLNYLDSVHYGAQWEPMKQNEKHEEKRIWIITEWDRSATTILFPDEY